MRGNKLFVIALILVMFIVPLNLNAITIYDEDQVEYDETYTLCTNQYYEYLTTYEKENFMFVNSSSFSIIQANTTFDGTINIPVASNIENVILVEQQLDENNRPILSSEVRTTLNFTDCGNEEITEVNEYNNPTTTFTVEGDKVTVHSSLDPETSELRYQFIDDNFSEVATDGYVIDATDHDIIQFSEEIDDDIFYYEVYLNKEKNTYLVKDVDSFEVKRLALELINFKYVYYAIGFFVAFLIFTVYHRIRKRRYNIERSKQKHKLKKRR